MADRNVPRRPSTSTLRASRERSPSSHSANSDIFSDDYALEETIIADGFRPNITPTTNNASSSTRPSPPRPSRRTSQPRSSIDPAKEHLRSIDGPHLQTRPNSFTLRHDGRSSRLPRRAPSMASSIDAHDTSNSRPVSSISNFSLPRRHQSLYRGATGPSHPYAMYPQDISSPRPTSVATTVHVPESSLRGPSHPTHPYGMYPQNTLIEPDVSPETSPGLHFPVGFPGLGQQYQRRLGPDGEEADDIIGPDGHTEQLPPYTRYPHNTPRKLRPSPSIQSLAPEPELDPISPENESSQTLINNDVRALALSRDDSVEQPSPIHRANLVAPTTADELGQNESSKEKWTRKSKKRLFGRLPYWAAILIIILLIVLAAVLGGVIGGAVTNHKHTKHSSGGHFTPDPAMASATVYATVTTTLLDATPLSSIPANLPSLPQGHFEVPLRSPVIAQSSCLTTPGQQIAWSCSSFSNLDLDVIYADYGPTQITLMSNVTQGPSLRYGAQAPSLKSQTGISLMADVDDADRGPAYFFQQQYDKLVILPESLLTNESSSKRWLDEELHAEVGKMTQSEPEKRDSSFFFLRPGDRPWFCFWNNTMLEGFIYVTENTTLANRSATATASSFTSGMTPTLETSSASSSSCSTISIHSYTYPTPSTTPMAFPSALLSSVLGASSAIPSSSSASSSSSSWSLSTISGGPAMSISAYPSAQSSDTDHNKLRKRQGFSSNRLTPYPKIIKIEERRINQNGVQPYCQQMVILDDLSVGTATDASEDPIIIQLTEEEPAVEHRVVAGVGPTGLVEGSSNGQWRDGDDKDKSDWTKGDRRKGDWKNGDWHKDDNNKGDGQAKAETDITRNGRKGNANKREELVGRLIRELVGRRAHETRDSDADDDDGCRCEWIAA